MAHVTDRSHRIWYEVTGSGRPLTLIGGFALLHNQFDFCRQHLLEGGLKVIDWDYRHLGQSSRSMTEPVHIERWVDDLILILDQEGIDKTSIWCTSTGSPIGIRFASKYPDRIASLITYPWFRADTYWRNVFSAAHTVSAVFGLRQLSRVFAGVVLTNETLYGEQHFTYEKWAGPIYENNVSLSTMEYIMDALAMVDLSDDVPNIRCPTALLMGRDSALNEKEGMESASFAKLVHDFTTLKPDVRLEAIDGAGSTYCMITNPRETAQRVVELMRSLQ